MCAELKPYIRKVNYYETDQMAIVHHSNYIRWFEEARLDALEQLGVSYSDMEQGGFLIPVLDVSCQYIKTVRYGDTVEIRLNMTRFTGLKFDFSYEIYNKKTGELTTAGTSSHCILGSDFRPVRLKKEYPEIYKRFAELAKPHSPDTPG